MVSLHILHGKKSPVNLNDSFTFFIVIKLGDNRKKKTGQEYSKYF